MSFEPPTLKIRVALDAHDWGRSCHDRAKAIVGDHGRVLDSKWGREPSVWNETGRGWGRLKLDSGERGYVDACRDLAPEDSTTARLVAIIDRLTT